MPADSQNPGLQGGGRLPRRIHLLGVGGAGVSGVARILHGRGHRLTGHDRAASGILSAIQELDFPISLGESTKDELPADTELVIRSAAVPADDPQVLAAATRGIAVLKYAEVLQRLFPPRRTLGVAGTHGKTTTSWMLWRALRGYFEEGGPLDEPAALIGGLERGLGRNAVAGGDDPWFSVEACEYDRTFLRLSPFGAIVTNVEPDHLDYYGDEAALIRAFEEFTGKLPSNGILVVGDDVPQSIEWAAPCSVWRLGRELEIVLLGERSGCFRFSLLGPGFDTPPIALSVPGRFNVDNAALAIALAVALHGGSNEALQDAASGCALGVEEFAGAGRRFEPWGSAGGVDVVHDYAHHPTEVRVTIEAARRTFPGRPLHVLFQPHQHSRTARFLDDFAESLRAADRVVVADVYGARVHIDGERMAGSPELVTELRRRNVEAEEGRELGRSVTEFLEGLDPGAAALVLGAGDIEEVKDDLIQGLALRGAPRREPLR